MKKSSEPLQTRNIEIDPKSVEPITAIGKNAHFMSATKKKRLVENLKRDGVSTSSILIYRVPGIDKPVVLSGNHRREAAIEAGLTSIPAIEILSPLTPERRTALQLSHNSLIGEDDPNILSELYEGLPLDEKLYSALTDDDFKVASLDIDPLSVKPLYREVNLLFLPEEEDALNQAIASIEKRLSKPNNFASHWAVAGSDFDRFFQAIATAKKKLKISNNALAVRAIVNLALERLEEMEEEG